jgi:predicted ester cyclase
MNVNRRGVVVIGAGLLVANGLPLDARAQDPGASGPGIRLIQMLVDAVNAHDTTRFDQIYAPGSAYVNHQTLVAAPGGVHAREGFKAYIAQRIAAFPDLSLRAEIAFESADFVAVNLIWSGTHQGTYLDIPATGKKVSWNSTDILRVKNGLFSDHWGAVDFYGLARQLKG